ncbi:MAG TPA: SDR family oxidoreductase [Roseiarcus sp.]|nr:SDR family oxidoreductase [Roseiarcus sp.]
MENPDLLALAGAGKSGWRDRSRRNDDERGGGAVRLFCFGLGYSARRIIARGESLEASGTTRGGEAATALRRDGVAAFAFDGERGEEALLHALARAQVLLVTAPPGEGGDPALAHFSREIAAAPDLERVVYLSSVGVYGDRGGAWVNETSPPSPDSPRARWRLLAEDQWRGLSAARGVPVDILRLAGIYGPGRNALVKLRAGEARRVVKPGQVFNRIHVDDVAGVALRLIAAGGKGEIWNVADEEPAPPQDVVAFAASLLGMAPPPEEALETAPLSPMARSFYDDNRRVSVEKLRRELGYRWLYPTYREGLRALAAAGEGRESENRA